VRVGWVRASGRGSLTRFAVPTHKRYVYIDPSGWSPKYFPLQLVKYANTLLKDKVLFGSDYPVITPDRWLSDFDKLDIKPDVRNKTLKDNAAGLLGLTQPTGQDRTNRGLG
jgi:predicted TIM-barrel fold metal-dependent hydrolase